MKIYKPTTPSRRNMTGTDFSSLTDKEPEKRLLKPLLRRAGRAASGRITVRHKGGGVKKLYRIINFGQKNVGMPAKVIALEYDPYRPAFIALIQYQNGEKNYIIAPQGLKVGDEVVCAEAAPIVCGNRLKLKNIPVGTMVHNIEIECGRGGILARGAGTSARIMAYENKYANLEMPSGEIRKINGECFASIGAVSNPEHRFVVLGKAGISRYKGRRPGVRGTAMNPCDHPHGGGEGGTSIGLKYPKTPWGKHALGVKTRNRRRWTNKFIIQRRKKKK